MDTRTGEVFDRGPAGELLRQRYGDAGDYAAAQLRMAQAQARGELAPVSAHVARTMRAGQAVEARRRKRKAAKVARRGNRG